MSNPSTPSPAMFAQKAQAGPAYRIFTVAGREVTTGVVVDSIPLKGVDKTITAVVVGEEGRGRQRGVLPCPSAPLVPCPDQGREVYGGSGECSKCQTTLPERKEGGYYVTHPVSGQIDGRLMSARVGKTQSGKPRLDRANGAVDDSSTIIVFRTPMGYRGGNQHTGPSTGWKCSKFGCGGQGVGVAPETCPECGEHYGGWMGGPRYQFAEFPGEVLAEGTIAEGAAGRMGSGRQMVAVVKKDAVFRVRIFTDGRRPAVVLYGWFDGEKVTVMTNQDYSLYLDSLKEGEEA